MFTWEACAVLLCWLVFQVCPLRPYLIDPCRAKPAAIHCYCYTLLRCAIMTTL